MSGGRERYYAVGQAERYTTARTNIRGRLKEVEAAYRRGDYEQMMRSADLARQCASEIAWASLQMLREAELFRESTGEGRNDG